MFGLGLGKNIASIGCGGLFLIRYVAGLVKGLYCLSNAKNGANDLLRMTLLKDTSLFGDPFLGSE